MRILPVILIGASALVLSACDDHKPRKTPNPQPPAVASTASADCCCKEMCSNPQTGSSAPVVGTLEQEGVTANAGHGRRVGAGRRDEGAVRRVSHDRRAGYRYRSRSGTEGVGYLDEDLAGDAYGYRRGDRSGTEGVGYFDEERGGESGGYRRDSRGGGYRVEGRGGSYGGGYRSGASVSVEERETYEERARYSESGYRYASGGGYEVHKGRDGYGGHGRHGRRGGGGYAGVDRDGYLTWPGKTED